MLVRLALFSVLVVFSLFMGAGAGCASTNAPASTATPVIATQAQPSATPIEVSTPSRIPTETSLPALQSASTAVPAGTPTPEPRARPTVAPTGTLPPASPVPSTAQGPFSGAAAYQYNVALSSTIGSRPGGSTAFQQAAEYIRDQLAEMGYQVSLQPYPVTSFQEKSTTLSLTSPKSSQIGASAITYSGVGEAHGDLAYCGLGRQVDFPSVGVQGKIALMDRGEITFQAKVDAAMARGAAGVIIANNQPGALHGTLSRLARIPAVVVSQADGASLRSFAAQGRAAVDLAVDASVTSRQGQNVVAVRAGDQPGGKSIVLGAHYDSVSAGPGANDNGSGVATILELARETIDKLYPFDLVFVAFGDEETGLVGSRAFVASLSPEERAQIQAMLNFDMVGVGTAMEFDGDKSLAADVTTVAQSIGVKTKPSSLLPGQSSDHASFLSAGIPAIFFYRSDDPNYHTSLDTVDKVSADNLGVAGDVALRLLDRLAGR